MVSREEQKKAARERVQKNFDEKDTGNFSGKQILDLSKIGGYKKELFFKPKEGNNLVDIIPYLVSTDRHPQKVKKGYPDYVLDLWIHRRVGPSEGSYICLQKMYGTACPICEEREELRKNPDTSEDEIKALYPKRRCWYNVINLNLPEKEQVVQIFEESHFLFEKELLEEAGSSKEGFIPFFDIEDGKSIEFRTAEEKSKMGKFFKYKKISFVKRPKYGEDIYDLAYSLDSIYHIPTYEEVRNAFYGVPEETVDEMSAEADKEEKAVEEPKRIIRRTAEPEEEPVEEKPKRVRKQIAKEEPKGVCPQGLTFGKDNDEDPKCGSCDNETWEKCADARDQMGD